MTDGKIHATDYITIQADAYRTEVAKIAKMKVKMDMDMYEALNGSKPKTYEEFMDVIIKKGKPDGIQFRCCLTTRNTAMIRTSKNSSSSSTRPRRRRWKINTTRKSGENDGHVATLSSQINQRDRAIPAAKPSARSPLPVAALIAISVIRQPS